MDHAEKSATPPVGKPAPASGEPRPVAIDWIVLLVLVVIWGSTFAGIRIGVETIAPAWLVTGRLLGAAVFLGLYMAGSRMLGLRRPADSEAPVSLKAVGWFSLVGVAATALPFVLYATAAETTGSAVMAICNGATPFGTAILAHLWLGDRLTARRTIGVMLGFAGLAVLVLPEFGEGAGGSLIGILIAILGAWLYSLGNVVTRIAPRVEPAMSSFIIVGTGGISALVLALATTPFPQAPSAASVIAMVTLALLPTAFAMFLYVWLIQRAGPVFVSFTTYLSPLWATGLGVGLMHEALEWSMLGALALILLGVAVANAAPRRRASTG